MTFQVGSLGDGKIIGLLLAWDEPMARHLIAAGERMGREVKLVAADYDFLQGGAVAGRPVAAPMDYLSAADIDAGYRDLYVWQQRLLAGPAGEGKTVLSCSSPEGYVPSAPGWLMRFGAHIHLRIRLVRFIRKLVETERPAVICPIGRSANQPWLLDVLDRTIAAHAPDVRLLPPMAFADDAEVWRVWLHDVNEYERKLREDQRRNATARLDRFLRTHEKSLTAVAASLGGGALRANEDLPALSLTMALSDRTTLNALLDDGTADDSADRSARERYKLRAQLERAKSRQRKGTVLGAISASAAALARRARNKISSWVKGCQSR